MATESESALLGYVDEGGASAADFSMEVPHREPVARSRRAACPAGLGLAAAALLALLGLAALHAGAPPGEGIPGADVRELLVEEARQVAGDAGGKPAAAAHEKATLAPELARALTRRHAHKKATTAECDSMPGVKLAEGKKSRSAWGICSEKWAEDCSETRCCKEWGMKCYEKSGQWAACTGKCEQRDEHNDTWSCRVLEPEEPRTPEACAAACAGEADCRQGVFSAGEGGKCTLSPERSKEVVWAGNAFNSSFCGGSAEDRSKSLGEVQKSLPFRQPLPPAVNCSWAGEDCTLTQCCNEVSCTEDFSSCSGYQCYRKKEGFSGCQLGDAPEGWDGTWLGGTKDFRSLPPAEDQVAMQGTSLYCFMVVSWDLPAPKPFWDSEAMIANSIKEQQVSIMQCDAHDFYDGIPCPKAEWGSFSNIDAFLQIWQQVRERGTFREHDWTVKVDVDAVFFPERLKMHLDKLRTPLGARVYLENTEFRFKFMGALEVLTREAVQFWADNSLSCVRGEHAGGEDFFMKGCMDALGIDHQSDFELLSDKYALGNDIDCNNQWIVAFHFHKKVPSWWWCHNEAACGNREGCNI